MIKSRLMVSAVAVVFASFVAAPISRAAGDCHEGGYCDEEASFSVNVPAGYTSVKRPVFDIAVQLKKDPDLERSGANCPIVSELHMPLQLWKGSMGKISMADEKGFWERVFALAQFKNVQIRVISKIAENYPNDDHRISLVEVTFRYNNERLKARQGMYWSDGRIDGHADGDVRYIEPRVYFVNCTSRADSFEAEKKSHFLEVFKSFKPTQCYHDENGATACVADEKAAVSLSLEQGPATQLSTSAPDHLRTPPVIGAAAHAAVTAAQ